MTPTICRLCGQAEGSTKVYVDCGAWQGVAHQDCLEAWTGFSKGRMTLGEVGRMLAAATWQRILQRAVAGFKPIEGTP